MDCRIAAAVSRAFLGFRFGGSLGRGAFAETIPGIDSPGTITWTTTYYSRVTSADGKRTWLQEERRLHAYRHPGQYRETFLDKAGQPESDRDHRRPGGTDARAGPEGEEGRPEIARSDIPTFGGRSPGSVRRSAIAWSPRCCA